MLVELKNICAGYTDLQVLFDVNLHVNKGEIVALLGQNGAGKTTILKVISGLVNKKSGSIHKIGNISYVAQNLRVFPNLTVTENVLVLGDKTGIPKYLKDLFPILIHKKNTLGKNLSGGEQQMVAMARALIDQPDLLLLDEPTLGLSPKLVKDLFTLIDKVKTETGLSILIIEHNLNSLLEIVDRGYVLERGKIVQELNKNDFTSRENVYKKILGQR